MINEPSHAKGVEFIIKELNTELTGQQRHVLDDCQTHAPLVVFCELDYGRQQRLRQLLDPNHRVHAVQVRNDVQSHFRALVF